MVRYSASGNQSADANRDDEGGKSEGAYSAGRSYSAASDYDPAFQPHSEEPQGATPAYGAPGTEPYESGAQSAPNSARRARGVGNHSRTRQQRAAMRPEVAGYSSANYVGANRKQVPGHRRRKSHVKRNVIIGVVAVLVIAIVAWGVALVPSVKTARADANTLMSQGRTLVDQLKDGNKSGALQTSKDLSITAKKLDDNVGGFLWAPATLIPVYGSDVAQVRTIVSVANTLCAQALDPLINAMPAGGMSEFTEDDGLNVDAIEALLKPLSEEYPTIHACAEQVDDMGATHLEQLREPVQTVKSMVGMLDTVSEYANDLASNLPSMLGANGEPAHYLLVAANNAEPRSTGGMAGSYGIMTVTNGKMSMGEFTGIESVPRPDEGTVLPLTQEELDIFGLRVGCDMRDVGFIPNYPRVAEIEAALWELSHSEAIDGVITLDPVFLQRILALTGGVTASNGWEVNGDNAAQMLMNEVYLRYGDENELEDAFFADVASEALDKVLGNLGDIDFTELVKVVGQSFEDRRLNIWMANPEEEAVILKLGAGGAVSASETEPEAGIYFGAASGAKSFWYLDVDATIGEGHKNGDGSTSYDVTVTFTNTLSNAEAQDMSWYITGEAAIKRSYSDMHLDLYLFAPVGGSISNVQTNGYFFSPSYFYGGWQTQPGPDPMTKAQYGANEVWYGVTGIDGSSSTRLTFTVTTSTKAKEDLQLDITPVANESL